MKYIFRRIYMVYITFLKSIKSIILYFHQNLHKSSEIEKIKQRVNRPWDTLDSFNHKSKHNQQHIKKPIQVELNDSYKIAVYICLARYQPHPTYGDSNIIRKSTGKYSKH